MLNINKVYNIDCIDGMKQIDDQSVDLVVTSPPYDNLRSYEGFIFDYEKTIVELYRVLKQGGIVVWVVNDATNDGTESLTSFRQALCFKDNGFNVHDTMIYQKENYIPLTHNRYEQCFDYMFVFSKGKPKTFNPIMIPCLHSGKVEKRGVERRGNVDSNQAMRSERETSYRKTNQNKIHPNIFTYVVGQERTGHPAAFPNKLARDMISSWSNEGDLVLDPFIGSGTTAVEAIKKKRNFIGFDVSAKYVAIANKRIENEKSKIERNLFKDLL